MFHHPDAQKIPKNVWVHVCETPQLGLKPCVAENKRNKAIGIFNKLTSVFHASVLLLIMNFVIALSK